MTREQGGTRTEHDSMGDVQVPAAALWQAQTQRAVDNFAISGERLDPAHLRALAQVKAACAAVNARLGVLPPEVAAAIESAAADVVDGKHAEAFPVDVFQTGSGTSSNMNMNEVLATLASRAGGRRLHPNDDVNASQSSNDVFPTSIHVAAAAQSLALLTSLRALQGVLELSADSFADVVKTGRTHMMDAVPVTLGAELAGFAAQVGACVDRIESALPRVCSVPLGGSAVGTGLNTPPGWRVAVVDELAARTDLPLTAAGDGISAQSSRDALVELSGQLRVTAVALTKICNDLRLMGSGPSAGLGEIHLPDLQPGSSIMPGKVNPVIPEVVLQVCAQVVGNDLTITWAGAGGAFELNTMMPVLARNLLESLRLLRNAVDSLATRCVPGITANREHLRVLAESSPALVTSLNPLLGYEEAAAIAKQAVAQGRTIREVVLDRGHVAAGRVTQEQLDDALDVDRLARPPE
jgi:fumarate hydratase class II